jgi:hypothetical protein
MITALVPKVTEIAVFGTQTVIMLRVGLPSQPWTWI